RELGDYTAWVAEDLASPGERVTRDEISSLLGRRFADLNFLVLERWGRSHPARPALPPDDAFLGPDEGQGPRLLTHRDVRAIALSRMEGIPPGPLWDVGAGLGGMAVGMANRLPDREVVAVERSARESGYLAENRARFEAWNIRIRIGQAPE